MSRGPDAATLLRRALERSADAAGVRVTVDAVRSDPWASATFTGARHTLDLIVAGSAALRWLADLPEVELAMRGHLCADLVVVRTEVGSDATTARVEALTVEER